MKIRRILLLSIFVIGLMSGCKGTMKDVGSDATNRDHVGDRVNENINNINRDFNNDKRFNTRTVRDNNTITNREVCQSQFKNSNNNRKNRTDVDRQGNTTNNINENRAINNRGTTTKPRMRVADKAADRVAQLREVNAATVVVTENNAYVAAQLNDSTRTNLSKSVEKKIADKVKSADKNIENVYVSVNPDFFDRTTSYAQDIRQGRPVSGFFDEFTEMIERVFPNNVK